MPKVMIDIEMPKSCYFDCKFVHPTLGYCLITKTPLQATGKPINCPLKDVKEWEYYNTYKRAD